MRSLATLTILAVLFLSALLLGGTTAPAPVLAQAPSATFYPATGTLSGLWIVPSPFGLPPTYTAQFSITVNGGSHTMLISGVQVQ